MPQSYRSRNLPYLRRSPPRSIRALYRRNPNGCDGRGICGKLSRQVFCALWQAISFDGVGPEDIGIDQLLKMVLAEGVEEVILATNLTVEGEATAHYICEQLRLLNLDHPIKLSRIAQGVPTGGELEYVDGNTLSQAFAGRKAYS